MSSSPLSSAVPTAAQQSGGKARGSLEPWLKDEVQYYKHQTEGVRRMARMQSFLLADDMGLGKSLQALTVAAIDIFRGRNTKVLVVAPVSLKTNWAEEIEKFTRIPYVVLGQKFDENGKIVKLNPDGRILQLLEFDRIEGPKILITNYEQIVSHKVQIHKMMFDTGIFDEAHYLKSPKSARTKACHYLDLNRTMLLTGTPMLNQVNELWSLLTMIDPARWSRKSYFSFVNQFCVMGGFKDKQIVGVKNEKKLTEYLQSVMIRRLKSEVLDLPDVQIIQRKVDLLPKQRKLYDTAMNELQVDMVGLDQPYEIDNALTKFTRLKQICGTTLAFDGEDNSAKLDLVISDAMEVLNNGHKLVIFTQFRPVQEALVNRFVQHGAKNPTEDFDVWELHGDIKQHERQPTVHMWGQDPKPTVIVCMLQVAGIGLNMTYARNGFFVDKLFVPGLNQQAVDRMHRIGASETQPVQISEYICRNTIENRVEAINVSKKKLFTQIVDESDYKRELIKRLMAREEEDDIEEE
jgi:SNF2 family DNA or RNA helicase